MVENNPARDIVARARQERRQALSEADGKALLAAFGIAVPRAAVARDAEDAAALAAGLAGPFAVKVMSPDILHKSDAGGVALHLADAAEVGRAVREMAARPAIAAARVDGWLVEEMAPRGIEVAVGAVRDPQFGFMIMVGLGGIFIEVLKDVAFRICPITETDAQSMLDELRGAALLRGVRGQAAVDRQALVRVLMAVGGAGGVLDAMGDDLAELDINPLIASAAGVHAVDARFVLTAPVAAGPSSSAQPSPAGPASTSAASDVLEYYRPLFRPRTVAVLGASTRSVAIANTFIRRLKAYGYDGEIYPIHPNAPEVEGLPAYPGLAETPRPVDYAYVAIGAAQIPDVLGAAAGRCCFAQVISSGFGETEEGEAMQRTLVEQARAGGVRVLGPNCLGTYSPRGKLTFPADAPAEAGGIGIVSQSGGLSTDIIKRGQWRGLRFSGLVTIGNSADIAPHDLLAYYLHDPDTRAIGLYLEDIKNGRAFFDLLRNAPVAKPVVILKGGTTSLGRLAASSHTGALAGNERAWDAMAAQTPVAMVQTVDEFINALLALQHLTPRSQRPTHAVTLFGNGGGSSVLGADSFAREGLEVAPFGPAARAALEALGFPPGTSVVNPIDTPVRTLQEKDGWVAGEILDLVYEHARPDAVAMHLNLAAFVGRGAVDPIGNLLAVVEQTQRKWAGQAHFLLALRSDGSPELDDGKRVYRERARAVGVPVFDEIPDLAKALAVVSVLETRLAAWQAARGR
ncbi:acetate--CoA ligase family protein [Bordetella genomosp. 10]|nr:acetate--CoA ligase family protein [Bordetella genomosp. 10]